MHAEDQSTKFDEEAWSCVFCKLRRKNIFQGGLLCNSLQLEDNGYAVLRLVGRLAKQGGIAYRRRRI